MKTRFGLVFFDVDSTLVDIEGIDYLAAGNPAIVALTEAAMNGEVPLEEVYARRLEMVRPSQEQIKQLGRVYIDHQVEDAREVIATLRDAHVDVHIVSAGIEQAILPLAQELGLQARAVHAVRLSFDERGGYAGFDRKTPLTRSRGKETVVRNIRSRAKGKVAFVGDGVSDLETKDVVDLFVGFGGVKHRAEVAAGAHAYITDRSFRPLLELLEEKP